MCNLLKIKIKIIQNQTIINLKWFPFHLVDKENMLENKFMELLRIVVMSQLSVEPYVDILLIID